MISNVENPAKSLFLSCDKLNYQNNIMHDALCVLYHNGYLIFIKLFITL